MNEFIISLTRGNVAEVKIVLASIVAVLALYQVMLMAVGYRKVSLGFLRPAAASRAHRAIGDAIVVLTVVTAIMCIGNFEIEDEGGNLVHAVLGSLLLIILAIKIAVVRQWVRADRLLPWLGLTLFALFAATWLSSAARYLE